MNDKNKTQLGKILLKQKLVGPTELDALLDEQRENPGRLASRAIAKGMIDELKALKALSEQHGIPAVNLDEVEIQLKNLELVPRDIAAKHLILPTSVSDDTINLAMANPTDKRVVDEIEFVSGKRVFPHVVLHSQLTECIEACYQAHSSGEKVYRGKAFGRPNPANVAHPTSATTEREEGSEGMVIADSAPSDVEFCIDVDIPIDDVMPMEPSIAPSSPIKSAPRAQTTFPPKSTASASSDPGGLEPSIPPRKPTRVSGVASGPVPERARPTPSRVSAPAQTSASAPAQAGATKTSPAATSSEEASSSSVSKKILVVDDEDDIRLLIARVLKDRGYEVVTAARGLEAIQKVQTECPDLIVLDAMLPEVHGFDICKKIKGSSKYGHIPVIMISAIYRGWRYAQDLKDSYGVDDFIEKPFKISELVEKVEKHGQKSNPETATRTEELSKEAERTLAAGIDAYKKGKIDEAVDLLRKGVSIDPLAFKLHYHLALLLGKKGLSYQAIRSLESALELAPDYFPALKNLAVLYQKAGFKFKAIETWERALGHCSEEETREGIKRHLVNLL